MRSFDALAVAAVLICASEARAQNDPRWGDWRIVDRGADSTVFIDNWSIDQVDEAAKFTFAVVARENLPNYSPGITREISQVIVDCRSRRYRQSNTTAGSGAWPGPDPPVAVRIPVGGERPNGYTARTGSVMDRLIGIACGGIAVPTEATDNLVTWAHVNYPQRRPPRRRR